MLDKYRKIQIDFAEFDSLYIPLDVPVILEINWRGVSYEFLIKLKSGEKNMLILGSGGGANMEMPNGPPYFQRHSWMDDFKDSVIYYNDPTLYLGKLPLGWGQGTAERFYLEEIALILLKLFKKIQYETKDVVFYGSSGGGFMSMILAGYIRGSKALVNNPQTCLTRWLKTPVQSVFNLSYQGLTTEEVINRFGNRINVVQFFKSRKYVPEIYYLQNGACEFDVTNHLIPFLDELQHMDEKYEVKNVKIDLYYNKKMGHAALGKPETVLYTQKIRKN